MQLFRTAVRTVITCVLVLTPSLGSAADTWVEARSPNFTVLSNAGEGRARNVAWQFEQIRSAIEQGWPWARVKLNRPLLVIAVKDEASMKGLAPSYWEKGSDLHPGSIFGTAGDRHYIALRADLQAEDREGINPYRSAYWSYSALTLEAGFNRGLPLWLTTGLSAVLSNSIVRETEIQFGRPIPSDVRRILEGPRLSLQELVAVDRMSPHYTRQLDRGQFDAQCWGLLQYLLFGEKGGPNDHLNRVARLLLEGAPSDVALKEVYGKLEALDAAYMLYLKQGMLSYVRLKVDTDLSARKYPTRDLPVAESAAARAGFHLAMGRSVEARALLDEARKADASLAASYEVEGMALDRENKRDEARQAFTKAAELNSSNFYVYLRLANLEWHQNADAATVARVQKLLARAISLNDAFAPSFSFLASLMLQLNQPQNAIGLAERAASLEPGQFSYRIQMAQVLSRLARRPEAQKAAKEALELARTDQERSSAQSLLDLLNRPAAVFAPPPQPPPPPSAPVRVGAGINAPQKIKDVKPDYPAAAQAARVQGMVIVEATIGGDGSVQEARVLRSIPLLDEVALDAVKQWQFTVTRLNGVPVPVIMTVTVNFSLQ